MPATKQPQKRKKPLTDKFLNSLPLWKLLSIAMVDLRKQERASKSEVDMWIWLKRNGKCCACMAGSVLRFSCAVNPTRWTEFHQKNLDLDREPEDPSYKWRNAVDCMRCGGMSNAADYLDRSRGKFVSFNREISDYHEDGRAAFWRDITQLRDDLKKAGL